MYKVFLVLGLLFSSLCSAETLQLNDNEISYSVRSAAHNKALDKLSVDIEIELVNGRLPKAEEISLVSKEVLASQPKAKMTWVLYFLPKMPSDAGAYATDHRAPNKEGVKILDFMLYNTPYQELME